MGSHFQHGNMVRRLQPHATSDIPVIQYIPQRSFSGLKWIIGCKEALEFVLFLESECHIPRIPNAMLCGGIMFKVDRQLASIIRRPRVFSLGYNFYELYIHYRPGHAPVCEYFFGQKCPRLDQGTSDRRYIHQVPFKKSLNRVDKVGWLTLPPL